ncbi:MAG TPA: hypothetical protein VK912_18585 [Longimicrobiales bacterium]|nr:hypothetical protein [Longimicrobiales bacterium]
MKLGLSSAAAPESGAEDLVTACAARGLTALELRAGDGHGVEAGDEARIADLLALAAGANVDIAGYRAADSRDAASLARLSKALCTAIIVADECDTAERIHRARRIVDAGGRALVAASGAPRAWHSALTASGLDYAWEVDAASGDVSDAAETVLRQPGLRYIRFVGGGPESSLQEGRGIGALMGGLALAAYDGPVILAPSSTRYRVAWETWLGRRGGWGCGSKSSAPELVHLPVRTAT